MALSKSAVCASGMLDSISTLLAVGKTVVGVERELVAPFVALFGSMCNHCGILSHVDVTLYFMCVLENAPAITRWRHLVGVPTANAHDRRALSLLLMLEIILFGWAVCQNNGSPLSFWGEANQPADIWKMLLKFVLPVVLVSYDGLSFGKLTKHNTVMRYVDVVYDAVRSLLDWLVVKLNLTAEVPQQVKRWLVDTVKYGPIIDDQASYAVFARDNVQRSKLVCDIRCGESLYSQCLDLNVNADDVNRRLVELKKFGSCVSALYTVSDMKPKPVVILLMGDPGVGKTTMVDLLMRDVLAVEGHEYDPKRDRFTMPHGSVYFDGYTYQAVYDVQELLQSRDVSQNMCDVNQLLSLMDESSAPLNMAACESKGCVYFSSRYIVMTTNHSLTSLKQVLAETISEPDAFMRRIDVVLSVDRRRNDVVDVDNYVLVDKLGGVPISWPSLLVRICTMYRDAYRRYREVSTIAPSRHVNTVVSALPSFEGEMQCMDYVKDAWRYMFDYPAFCRDKFLSVVTNLIQGIGVAVASFWLGWKMVSVVKNVFGNPMCGETTESRLPYSKRNTPKFSRSANWLGEVGLSVLDRHMFSVVSDMMGSCWSLLLNGWLCLPLHVRKSGCSYTINGITQTARQLASESAELYDRHLWLLPCHMFGLVPSNKLSKLICVDPPMMLHFACLYGLDKKPVGDVNYRNDVDMKFDGVEYTVDDVYVYSGLTKPGDCGRPLIGFFPDGKYRIVGLHIAGGIIDKVKYGMSCVIDKQLVDILLVRSSFARMMVKDIPVMSGQMQRSTLITPQLPKTTNFRSTRLTDSLPDLTRPSMMLKPGFTGFEGFKSRLRFDVVIGSNAPWLSLARKYYDDYKGTRNLISWDVICGDDQTEKCLPRAGSCGYPLMGTVPRTNVVTVQSMQDFNDYFDSIEDGYVVVVDCLKDERREHAKVDAGNLRVITIYPVLFNCLVKRYFGKFFDYVQASFQDHPIKIGISDRPDDWSMLYNYLHIEDRQVVAGDFSKFDVSVPYYVLEGVAQSINEWYSDGHMNIRHKLIQCMFRPLHLIGKDMYCSVNGLPSGLYGTSVFGSMVVLGLLDLAARQCCAVDPVFAIYGDDHLATSECGKLTGNGVKALADRYGMKYTSPDKGPVTDFVDDPMFLHRRFRIVDGIIFGQYPMECLEQVMRYVRKGCGSFDLEIGRVVARFLVAYGRHEFRYYMDKWFPNSGITYVDAYQCNVGIPYMIGVHDRYCYSGFVGESDTNPIVIGGVDAEGIDSPIIESNRSGLMHFDEQRSVVSDKTQRYEPVDVLNEVPSGLSDVLCRPVRVYSGILPTTHVANPVLRLDPVSVILSDDYYQSKLEKFSYMMYDIDIHIRIVATKFHYGMVMAVWRPMYLNHMARNVISIDYEKRNMVIGDPAQCGPYDLIHTASQCDHVLLPVGGETTGHLQASFCTPYQYVPVRDAVSPIYHLGVMDVYNITPISPTTSAPPHVMVYAALTNVRLFGYDSTGVKMLKVTDPGQIKTTSVACPDIGAWAPLAEPVKSEISMFGEVDETSSKNWFRRGLDLVTGIASSVVSIGTHFIRLLGPVSTLASMFGFSKVPDVGQTQVYTQTQPNVVSTMGQDRSMPFTYHCANLMPVDCDEVLVEKLAERSTYLGCLTTGSKTLEVSYPVDPCMEAEIVIGGKKLRLLNVASWLLLCGGSFYRGHVRYELIFTTTPLANVRFAVSYVYTDQYAMDMSNIESLAVTELVEVTGCVRVTIDVPYLHYMPLKDLTDGFIGRLIIKQLTPVVSALSTVPLVYCAVFQSVTCFQMSGPGVVHNHAGGYGVYRPFMSVSPSNMVGESATEAKYSTNDFPYSIHHMAKRLVSMFYPKDVKCMVTWNPWSPQASLVNGVYVLDRVTKAHDIALMFRFWRTSINMYTSTYGISFDGRTDSDACVSPRASIPYFTCDSVPRSTSGAQVRLPFISGVRFLTTPITDTDGESVYYSKDPNMRMMNYTIPAEARYVGAADDSSFRYFIGIPLMVDISVEQYNADKVVDCHFDDHAVIGQSYDNAHRVVQRLTVGQTIVKPTVSFLGAYKVHLEIVKEDIRASIDATEASIIPSVNVLAPGVLQRGAFDIDYDVHYMNNGFNILVPGTYEVVCVYTSEMIAKGSRSVSGVDGTPADPVITWHIDGLTTLPKVTAKVVRWRGGFRAVYIAYGKIRTTKSPTVVSSELAISVDVKGSINANSGSYIVSADIGTRWIIDK